MEVLMAISIVMHCRMEALYGNMQQARLMLPPSQPIALLKEMELLFKVKMEPRL